MDKLKVSISGIRGIVGDSLTPEVIIDYATSYAAYIKQFGNTVAIACDTRKSRDMIFNLVAGALMSCGINVVNYSILPTPLLIYAVRKYKYAGGIIITASHNPQEWNALKFIKKDGYFFFQKDLNELLKIKNSKNKNYSAFNTLGNISSVDNNDFIDEYLDDLFKYFDVNQIKEKQFNVAYDPVNATGEFVTPKLLEKLNCNVFPVNSDLSKDFSRGAEPLPENLGDLSDIVKSNNLDIGFAQDPDADRLALVDENGNPIGEEYTLVLAILNSYKYKNIKTDAVLNLSTSMMNSSIAGQFGYNVFYTKVGEINVTDKMLKIKSEIGGEGNGGVIFPQFNSCRDSFVAIMFILELLSNENKALSEIVNHIPKYFINKTKVKTDDTDLNIVYSKIKNEFNNCYFNEEDGLKVSGEHFWLHVRPSNTEPVVRIIVESKSKEKNKEYIKKIEEIISA